MATQVRVIVRSLYDIQELRISLENRMEKSEAEFLKTYCEEIERLENSLIKVLKKELQDEVIYRRFLLGVKGVGPLMAGVIVSEYDIYKADTVSKLWKYTGIAPGYDKKVKGQKLCYNPKLKSKMLGVLALSFLRTGSPYRKYYDDYKLRLESEESWKDVAPAHRDRAARRYMIKMFLKDLYVQWRTLECLPVREPYQAEYLGHSHQAK